MRGLWRRWRSRKGIRRCSTKPYTTSVLNYNKIKSDTRYKIHNFLP